MQTRDEYLIHARPEIQSNILDCTEFEYFQNNTLRPLLKLQNDLVISLFKENLKIRQVKVDAFTFTARKKIVRDSISKDLNLRSSIVYSIVGLFTDEEFRFFANHKKEVSKRIMSLASKRLQDQVELLG